jgi:hypothetical protein
MQLHNENVYSSVFRNVCECVRVCIHYMIIGIDKTISTHRGSTSAILSSTAGRFLLVPLLERLAICTQFLSIAFL